LQCGRDDKTQKKKHRELGEQGKGKKGKRPGATEDIKSHKNLFGQRGGRTGRHCRQVEAFADGGKKEIKKKK